MRYTTLILYIAILTLASCNVLDVKPQNSILGNDALKDKKGIEKGILGAYTSFQSLSYYGRSYLIFSDLASDNLEHPADATALEYAQVDNNAILPENASIEGIWASAYEGINIANNIIEKVPGIPGMTEDEKNAALGELYFIRALNHFNLMNYFGDIPLKVTATEGTGALNVARDPVSKVYEQIISDLAFAETHLGASTTVKVRASKNAAKALLARVYLYEGDYVKAKQKATEVINVTDYKMMGYGEVFQDGSAESIFEIDFTELNRNRIAEYNFPKSLNGRREVAPTANLLDAYESGDERYDVSIEFSGSLPYAIKYDDLSKGTDNVIVLRLAEMYLIRAEAEAKLEGNVASIQSDINKIRNRVGLSDTDADTYAELLLAIEQERRVEFAFEGHRWFDLVRTGRAQDVLPNVESINQTLFPIPLKEIVTNKNAGMKQNDGY